VAHRRQARREERFGESLRDQLNRRIAQLTDAATSLTKQLVIVLLTGTCPIAVLLLIWRINEKSFSDDGYMLVSAQTAAGSVAEGA
jgi:hypothetical protein